jgi:hypothetical protein
VTPAWSWRKSSSSSNSPLTTEVGAERMARIASEKMVALRRSLASDGLSRVNCSVAPDSMALRCGQYRECSLVKCLSGQAGRYWTYYGGPDAGNGHILAPFTLKVHGKPLCQHAHADLAHGIGCLATEEAAVDGRAHDNDTAATGGRAQMGQRGFESGVEAFRIDALHELEALQGRGGYGGPIYGARVVDEDVDAAICLCVCVSQGKTVQGWGTWGGHLRRGFSK